MRVLLLSTYFSPDIASTGVIMTALARSLQERGNEVTVLCTVPHYDRNQIWPEYRGALSRREQVEGISVRRLFTYVPGDKSSFVGRVLNYGLFNSLSVVAGWVEDSFDVILAASPPLTNGVTADLIARVRRVPFVYNVQDIWPDAVVRVGVLKSRSLIAVLHRMERYVYRRATALSVISEGFRRRLKDKGVPDSKIRVIPNFIDLDFVTPGDKVNGFSMRLGLESRFVVLFAGNLGHSQGLDMVLEAANQLKAVSDLQFLMVGNGVAKAGLERLAVKRGLDNVRFLPFQPADQLSALYASSDICLVTLRRGSSEDSVPCKVHTIMAAGRPIVASVDEGSDTWELVQKAECGLCVPVEDPGSLAGAVMELYQDRKASVERGFRGREYAVRHFQQQEIARQYEELLRSVI